VLQWHVYCVNSLRFLITCFFQVISLEGWTDIMYYVQDAHSFWDWIYFVLLIVVSFVTISSINITFCTGIKGYLPSEFNLQAKRGL